MRLELVGVSHSLEPMEELKQTMRDVGRHMLDDPLSGAQSPCLRGAGGRVCNYLSSLNVLIEQATTALLLQLDLLMKLCTKLNSLKKTACLLTEVGANISRYRTFLIHKSYYNLYDLHHSHCCSDVTLMMESR